MPLAEIAGTQCSGLGGVVEPGGTPPDPIHCAPGTGAALPDNSGDFEKCEVDFYMGYRGSGSGSGFWIAAAEQIIGGPAMDDDFGFSVFVEEDLPGVGTFGFGAFAPPSVSDFAEAEVCTDNIGICCLPDDGRSAPCLDDIRETECYALDGEWWAPCEFWDPIACDDEPKPCDKGACCWDSVLNGTTYRVCSGPPDDPPIPRNKCEKSAFYPNGKFLGDGSECPPAAAILYRDWLDRICGPEH